jgi:hypothetical protein
MNRDGCPIGTRRYGDKCVSKEIPMIGTYLVPSIENRTGCDYVKGKWVDEHEVCLLQDPLDDKIPFGLTAPVKGVYLFWNVLTPEDMERDKDSKEYYIYGNISMVADTPGFPHDVGGGNPVEEYELYEEFDSEDDAVFAARDDAMRRIAMIKEGTWYEDPEEPCYYTPDGLPAHHSNREAIYAWDSYTVRRVYSNVVKPDLPKFNARWPKKMPEKPFPIRKFYTKKDDPPADDWLKYNFKRHQDDEE